MQNNYQANTFEVQSFRLKKEFRGWFYKSWAHTFEKLFTGIKVGRKGVGRKQVYEINPRSQAREIKN